MKTNEKYGKAKIRQNWRRRLTGVLAGIIVFTTTYSLILPAITLDESTAAEEPGIVLNTAEEESSEAAAEIVEAETSDDVEEEAAEPAGKAEATEEAEAPAESSDEVITEEAETSQDISVPEESSEAEAAESSEEEPTAEADSSEEEAAEPTDSSKEEIVAVTESSEKETAAPADSSEEIVAEPAESTVEETVVVTENSEEETAAPAESSEEIEVAAESAVEEIVAVTESSEEETAAPAESSDEVNATPTESSAEESTAPEESVEESTTLVVESAVDVETAADWEAAFANIELTGDWAEDLLAVANTQIGYTESVLNTITDENGEVKGYTRYGAKYQLPYSDWNALFVQFCMEYAGIPEDAMPEMIEADDAFIPLKGDLVYFNQNDSTLVGIVSDVDQENAYITVLVGDLDNSVQYAGYKLNDSSILGFGLVLENPDYLPAQDFEAQADDVKIVVNAPAGAFPAGTTMTAELVEDEEILTAATTAVQDASKGEVRSAKAVDIVFYNRRGEEIEPQAAVRVSMSSAVVKAAEAVEVVHIDNEGQAEVVSQADDTETADDEVVFDAGGFSVYVIVGTELKEEITLTTPDGEDVTYVVSVTYGPDAEIPEGAYLDVTEYDSLDDKYIEAWDAVVAAKKNAHEVFDENLLGLSALDISIKDSEGDTIEPAEGTEVKVSIQMKELPKNIEENMLSETMEVQHLNESTGAIAVETVAKAEDINVENGIATTAFTIDSFSTFTITWSLPSAAVSDANASFRLRYSNPQYYNAYAQNVRVWYVDESGNNIQKPAGRNDVNINSNNNQNITINLDNYNDLSGYTFVEARVQTGQSSDNKPNGNAIDSVQFVRTNRAGGYTWTTNFIKDEETVATTSRTSSTGNDTAHVYLVYRRSNQRVLTVHYGYMNGSEFVEFESLPEGAQTTYGPPAMRGDQLNIRYDIPGKDYVTTRMGNPSTGTQISPLLQTENQANYSAYPYWKYRILNTLNVNNGINEWQRFTSNEDLYVIYRDTPTEKSYDDQGLDPEDLSAPASSKDVDNNGNGTYDISLSVTGQSNSMTNKTHANVVIVLDTSSSMDRTDIETTGQQIPGGQNRLQVAQDAIEYLADELFGFNTADDPAAIEVAFVDFSHRVRNEMTKDTIYSGVVGGSGYNSFVNLVGGLSNNGGTNYDTAIEAANSVLWNDADPVYVIFITDGDTVSRGYLPYDDTGAKDHAADWDGGTYYNGDSSASAAQYYARARSAAAVQVTKLLSDSNNKFYSIGVFGNVQYLPTIGGTYLGQANEQSKIEEAFAQIIDEIAMNLGYEDVTIHDGITAMTATTLVNGAVDQFCYEITLKDGTVKNYADGAALREDYPDIGLASYDSSTKAVAWELGDHYQLEDGVTYKVIFTVWPSQESYDLLADLNNGIKDYDTLDPTVKSQIIVEEGKYYLKTNTYSTIDYTSIKKEDGVIVDTNTVEGAEIKDPNGKMILDGTMLEMEKEWNDDLDPAQLLELLTDHLNEEKTDTTYEVILRLWQDKDTSSEKEISTSEYPSPNGFIYKPTVTITDGEVTAATWPKIDVAIAPGVLVEITSENDHLYQDTTRYPRVTYGSTTYAMLETGHRYIITEDNTDLHFELNTDVYHPMVVNGVLKTVKFSEDGKTITEMSPENTGLTTLTATNDLKGGLEIHKIVTTKDDKSDTVTSDNAFFTFNIKLQKSATDTTPVYTTPEQFNPDGSTISGSVGFRIFASADIPDEATNVADDQSSYEYDGNTYRANYDDSGAITGYTARGTIAQSGELNLKIRQSDAIRLVNLPAGTYYTVEETNDAIPAGYELLDKSNDSGTVPANSQALAEFWNKRTSFTIDLLKVDELNSEIVLEGAEFELYESDGETPAKDADGNAISTIKTGPDGKANIGKLLPGTYKLVETTPPKGYNLMTTPVTIVVSAEKVTYQQGSKQPSDAAKSTDGLTWTVIATNNTGVQLPHTGGSGTLPYTLGGIALLAFAASMYGFRMRRRERRLS